MLEEQELPSTGIYRQGTVNAPTERDGELQPPESIEALLKESKQLQAATMQLLQESRDRRTVLDLTLHLCKHHAKQLEPYRDSLALHRSRIVRAGRESHK